MKESNIFFVTNTYNYGDEYTGETQNWFNEQKGDVNFFRKVKDYDALRKLKRSPKMRGSMNSDYYVASIEQIRILDPNFISISSGFRQEDPEILRDNAEKDKEYGYPEKNNFYPLLGEIIVDNKEMTYADQLLGKWEKMDQGLSEGAGNSFGVYIKKRIEQDKSSGTVSPKESGLEDIDDRDPYYYIYEEAAGRGKSELWKIDKAKLYEAKFGSIFRAFSEVSQEEIIQAPAEQYSFVNAGPGTGKTYTLMKKIEYMIEYLGVDPEEILVLCFTNAAVNEIKARINGNAANGFSRSYINVDVRTFHSFSWLLISQANEVSCDRTNYSYIDLMKLNYDESIRTATRIIRSFGEEVFGNVKHLIVDEIQDLTNERASLVISMVRECIKNGVGITVLGDSCQAIYDYNDDSSEYELKSDKFYKYMFSEFFDCGKFYKLEKNHRQSDLLIRATSPLRSAILEGRKREVLDAIFILRQTIPEIIQGPLSVKASQFNFEKMKEKGTVCLMCRNNAQVLATSSNLRKRGIDHVVNAYNEFEYLADWIGKVFALFSKEVISYDEFESLVKKVTDRVIASDAWERLQDVIGSKNNVLKVSDILAAVAKSKVDDPVFRNVPTGNLIVSNIHKSKGREYDMVVLEKKFVNRLVNDSQSIKSVSQYLEEAKTLYVAITRPKTRLFFNSLASADVSLKMIRTGRKRWVRGDGYNLKNIEIRALSDADILSFDDLNIQQYIIENVSVGDEINLVMDINSMGISYNIVHVSGIGERVIGKSSSVLKEDIEAIITPYGSSWPQRITDLFVSGIHSQVSPDFKAVWCWVDFCGLGIAYTESY